MKKDRTFDQIPKVKPGDTIIHLPRHSRKKLRVAPKLKINRFLRIVVTQTPFIWMVLLLIVLWLLFAFGVYLGEREIDATTISSYGRALYWGVAAFSTAGIADTPVSGTSQIIGGIWIVLGSLVFFGTIVATVTTYFMRPLQRPARHIVDTIEYNLEQMDELSIDELALLKETTDALIDHVERFKQEASKGVE